MSRIDDLMRELAISGIPLVRLGEVSHVQTGSRPRDDPSAGGIYPFFNGGTRPSGMVSEFNVPGDVITIPSRGSVGVVGYADSPIWCGPLCYAIRSTSSEVLTRFLYYTLKSQEQQVIALQQSGSIPALNKKELIGVKVPIPPRDLQREIVRVLDHFTQLEAELEAELETRLRQFAFYRAATLTFDGGGVPWEPLGAVAEVRSGWGFPHADQGQMQGDYPFYKVSDMNLPGNETTMSVANNFVTIATAARLGVNPAPAGTVIFPKIGAAVATNKKRILSVASAYDNNVMGVVPSPRIRSRFFYHWMQTFDLTRLAHDSGAVPSIRKSEAELLMVPVPPLEDQIRIEERLDNFDALVNDISIGIPAELHARRKQYEYYRDKLLTFPEAVA